jgi:hypothetical protein
VIHFLFVTLVRWSLGKLDTLHFYHLLFLVVFVLHILDNFHSIICSILRFFYEAEILIVV